MFSGHSRFERLPAGEETTLLTAPAERVRVRESVAVGVWAEMDLDRRPPVVIPVSFSADPRNLEVSSPFLPAACANSSYWGIASSRSWSHESLQSA